MGVQWLFQDSVKFKSDFTKELFFFTKGFTTRYLQIAGKSGVFKFWIDTYMEMLPLNTFNVLSYYYCRL